MIRNYDRYDIRRIMQNLRGEFRRVWVLIATTSNCDAAGCGYDSMSDSAIDPTCSMCDGTGKTITFTTHELKARIKVFDFVQLQGAGAAPPGVELGDVALYIRVHDKGVLTTCNETPISYVKLEGDSVAYRPFSIAADGVGREDEIRVLLKKTKDVQRATGY